LKWIILELRVLALTKGHVGSGNEIANAKYCSIVGRNMLSAFGHPDARCCDVLGVVGSNFKVAKFFMQFLWMLHDVVVVCPGSCNNVALEHAHFFDFQ